MPNIFAFRKKQSDMTEGNLFKKIILFAIPALLTTVMQLLYVTIDLTTVHYGDSAESMGAIASNNALINLIVVVFMGVSLGGRSRPLPPKVVQREGPRLSRPVWR